jgi:hypothetical protein
MRKLWIINVGLCVALFLWPVVAQSNFLQASLFAQPDTTVPEGEAAGMPGSLFSGRAAGGMFAKIQPKADTPRGSRRYSFALRPGVVGLRDLIGRAEAGRANYDAVQHGARIKTPKKPTQMTIAEIYAWIDATPGQPHAIGRYQFIPPTLRRVVAVAGVPESAYFTPKVQDALADVLFADAGIQDFLNGQMTQTRFMNNLAKIWAGFPNSSGRSHYHGYAGNYATITWDEFKSAMDRIFPRG